MKKILCLLLTLVLAIACVSCKNKNKDNSSGSVESIANTVNSSNPTQVVTKVSLTKDGYGTLTSSYITEKDFDSGVEKFTFKTQKLAAVEEMLPESIKKIEGVVWKNADGSVTSSNGDSWSKEDAVGYVAEKLNIVASVFKTCEFKDNGNDLVAIADAKDAERLFGQDIGAKGDISIEIDTNGIYLYNVVVSYTTTDGAKIIVITSYDYAVVKLDSANK